MLHLLYANKVQRGGPLKLSGGTTNNTRPIEIIEDLTALHDVAVELRHLDVTATATMPLSNAAVSSSRKPESLSIHLDRLVNHEVIVIQTSKTS